MGGGGTGIGRARLLTGGGRDSLDETDELGETVLDELDELVELMRVN